MNDSTLIRLIWGKAQPSIGPHAIAFPWTIYDERDQPTMAFLTRDDARAMWRVIRCGRVGRVRG